MNNLPQPRKLLLICLLLILGTSSDSSLPAAAQGIRQTQDVGDLIADGQFVWGPNVGAFDVESFLTNQQSPLREYAYDVSSWAAYASVNPRVLLAALEVQHALVTSIPEDWDPDRIRTTIEESAVQLALDFYAHMYAWGARQSKDLDPPTAVPEFTFPDGNTMAVNSRISSGSYAVLSFLAKDQDLAQWTEAVSAQNSSGFSGTFTAFFPDVDLMDDSNDIQPDGPPPDDLFQLPFPLGAEWYFNGPHSFHGPGQPPPYSSMDFSSSWPACSPPAEHYSVAAADGNVFVVPPNPEFSEVTCWSKIDHGNDWTTSYYHMINVQSDGPTYRNQRTGAIGCEICNGGTASSAHVHFSVLYNGAYVSLEGVNLSGWTVHVGETPYDSGYLERDGQILDAPNTIVNDYHQYYGTSEPYALRFYGNAASNADLVKIQIDDPDDSLPGPPADLGRSDFVLEWWMKVDPGANTAPAIECGANDNWKDGNLIFDRRRSTGEREVGVSLAGGKIAVGISGPGTGFLTYCSTASVDDGEWHHIAVQRNRWDEPDGSMDDGQIWLFIDGVMQGTILGPRGDVSYPDNASPGNNCGLSGTEPCTDFDPYLGIGGSKDETLLSFHGWMDDIRISLWNRYFDDFTPPDAPHAQDSKTTALLRFDEGLGTRAYDTGGYVRGTSNGFLFVGGTPAGPEWTLETPWNDPTPPMPAVPADFDGDRTSDIVVFRSGAWRFFDFTSASFDHGVWTGSTPGCIPAAMDYDGDSSVEFTQLCNGAWHFYNDDGSYFKGIWTGGLPGDLPVPADYDGDGDQDVVVFRAGAWRFFDLDTGTFDHGVWTGSPPHWLGGSNIPVPMDLDGDGAAEFTIFSGGPWHFFNDDGSYLKGIWTGGQAGDLPAPADFDGDGSEEVVLWRAGAWQLYDFQSGDLLQGIWTGSPDHWFGGTSLPAPLDYDGDGALEFSVWAGGPWHFYNDDGSYLKGIWTGAVEGDIPISKNIIY